jgi:zona occludens toxin (predicted ATPase)
MLNSTTFVVLALIALAWLFLAVVVIAACRMAGRSDAEIGAADAQAQPTRPTVAPRSVRTPVAQPRAARYAARS